MMLNISKQRMGIPRRVFLGATIVLVLMSIKQAPAQEKLVSLYEHFRNQTNGSGFIAFTRAIEFPSPPSQTVRFDEQPDANTTQRRTNTWISAPPSQQYVAYAWSGSNFLIAVSRKLPLTNTTAIASADRLYAFDGEFYWTLTLNFPSRTYIRTRDDDEVSPPVKIANRLTIIPANEPDRLVGEVRMNPMLRTILNFAMECRRVVQFGYSYRMSDLPVASGTKLIVKGSSPRGTDDALLTGDLGRPDTVVYGPPQPYRVLVDYVSDSLSIERLTSDGKRRVNQTKYQILAVEVPSITSQRSAFSWQNYKPGDGDLAVETVRDGATHRAQILPNGSVVAGEIISPAKPVENE